MLLESKLITARDGWRARFKTGAEFLRAYKATIGNNKRIVNTPRLHARVNHGRWVADCPFCGGAEMVWLETPSLFFCFSCRNKAIGGGLLRVGIPKQYDAIEELLIVRHPANRNWQQGESLLALESENTRMEVA